MRHISGVGKTLDRGNRAKLRWRKMGLLTTAVYMALASQAQASALARNVGSICTQLNQATGQLTVSVRTGCKTGMAEYKDNNLQLVVDQDTAVIRVTGGIEYHPMNRQSVTRDCKGARSITLTADGIEARRYTVTYEGEAIGIQDMTQEPLAQQCLDLRARGRLLNDGVEVIDIAGFANWSDDPVQGWRDWRGDDVMSLLAPLLAGHPETSEGKPELSIDLFKARRAGRQISLPPIIGVRISRQGFLDDAVSGDRYFGHLEYGQDGWRIENLWGQQMCARGRYAGQWIASCAD